MRLIPRQYAFLVVIVSAVLSAQQPAPQPTTAADAPNRDTSYIDAQGTAHVTRVVPVPATISPEAQHVLGRAMPDQGPPETLAERRAHTDAYTAGARIAWTKICPNNLVEDKIAGVPVRIVTPEGVPEANRDKVLLNLHGGGFNSDSGSYTESIPIAGYTKIKVVAVLYRLAPEHPFPAAVDDSVAVYKELLKTYKPDHIVIYGTSAGAILTAEVAVKAEATRTAHAGCAWRLQRHGRLCARRRLDFNVCAARPLRPSGSPGRLEPTTQNMQPRPMHVIRCSRPSMQTCTDCRRRFLSRAGATCF